MRRLPVTNITKRNTIKRNMITNITKSIITRKRNSKLTRQSTNHNYTIKPLIMVFVPVVDTNTATRRGIITTRRNITITSIIIRVSFLKSFDERLILMMTQHFKFLLQNMERSITTKERNITNITVRTISVHFNIQCLTCVSFTF